MLDILLPLNYTIGEVKKTTQKKEEINRTLKKIKKDIEYAQKTGHPKGHEEIAVIFDEIVM